MKSNSAIDSHGFFLACCAIVCLPMQSLADESELGVALEKLEHLFDIDITVFEVAVEYGNEDGFFGFKVESELESDTYDGSESQLFYSRNFSDRLSGIAGVRHLHSDDGGDLSAMLGVTATAPFDIELLLLTFINDDLTEAQFEMERSITLQPRLELVPKIEFHAFSRDAETIAAEVRLAYVASERLSVYVGGAWFRLIGTASDDNELTTLAGLSYKW